MIFKLIRNGFISGLLLLAPVGVTVFLFSFLISEVGIPTRKFFFFFIPEDTSTNPWMEYPLYIAAVLIVAALITLLGWFSKFLLGKMLVSLFEKIVDNVPLIRNIYNSVKQIRDTFVQQKKAVFQKSVLVEYPRKGVWVLGFLTGTGKGEPQDKTSSELVNVFIPTTPNPTSGFLLMIKKDEVVELEMTISEGMKLIISGGAVVPPWPPNAQPNPLPAAKND